MEKKIAELRHVTSLCYRAAHGVATKEEDTTVYQMFGNLSQDDARGIATGIMFAVKELRGK